MARLLYRKPTVTHTVNQGDVEQQVDPLRCNPLHAYEQWECTEYTVYAAADTMHEYERWEECTVYAAADAMHAFA